MLFIRECLEKIRFLNGTSQFKNDTGSYDLTYKDGQIEKASIKYADGTTYIGLCNKDGPNDAGKMVFSNGDVYEGKYFQGKRKGKGTYSWKSGEKYEGEWKNDQMVAFIREHSATMS